MIQANELRLGNWVEYDNTTFEVKDRIQVDAEDFDLITNKNMGHVYHPIPLTPEILERCGFENDNGEYEHPDNTDFDLMFCCSPNGYWCGYNYGYQGNGASDAAIPQAMVANPICNPFKYVHQLQNLYFALTGKELNLNL